jgi:hypothetical protein
MTLREGFTSLVSSQGTLDGFGFAKHVGIAFVLFFVIAMPGELLFRYSIFAAAALKAPAWTGHLAVLLVAPFIFAACALWVVIIATSTVRLLRHVKEQLFGGNEQV